MDIRGLGKEGEDLGGEKNLGEVYTPGSQSRRSAQGGGSSQMQKQEAGDRAATGWGRT